jgi:hypothetical protein
MNGSKSPVAASAPAENIEKKDASIAVPNGHQSPRPRLETIVPKALNGSPKRSIEEEAHDQDDDTELPDAPPPTTNGHTTGVPDGDEDANSEAETVLTSPVKRREAEKRVAPIKQERSEPPKFPAQPSLAEDDDDEADAPGSPDDSAMPATAMAVSRAASQDQRDEVARKKREQSSESLSDVSPARSAASGQSSRTSSKSRARSERPGSGINTKHSPNLRKRKHRASSVDLPNKRPSMDVAKHRLRDLHSEGGTGATVRSSSPGRKGHRRAVSTQSVLLDGASEVPGNRKRRAASQFPAGETKAAKATWDESSVSSETTSHGHGDIPPRRRGIGRSTSTPAKPAGREHKRHINKYGFTKLAEACEDGDLDLVKEWREKDPDQLEIEEFAKNTPLQIASLNGNAEVVEYLIDQGCRVDCANVDKDTPLIDAAENGHADVVDILLNAGVDPLRQNLKGQQALDVVTDDTENATAIRSSLRRAMENWNSDDARKRREHEEEQRFGGPPSENLHLLARTYDNLFQLVVNNDRNSVREFLDARVPVDNNIIAAAAKTGDLYMLNMLLAEMTDKKAFQKPEKPLLAVLGTSHVETVKILTELDQFNPLWRNRKGKTWPELADEKHGPMWVQESELLHRLYNKALSNTERRSSSPVTTRDEVKRHPPPQSGDNSGEDSPPKRKNGKRLMTRREMRAASGKPFEESSSEDSSSETAREAEDSMKPPESPATTRGPGRPRRKSASSQPTDLPLEAARTRRRSSSLREKAESTLTVVDEQMEDVDNVMVANHAADIEMGNHATDIATVSKSAPTSTEMRMQGDDKASKEAAEAQEKEETAKKRDEHDARLREAQKAARKAEAEEKAEKQRLAQEAQSRQEEDDKKAEAAREAEEQRQRLETELSEAKSRHHQEVVSSLPSALSRTLHQTLDAEVEEGRLKNEVLEIFTPLQTLPGAGLAVTDSSYKSRGELVVLNAQAAPLLGKVGLDLLLRQNAPGYDKSLARDWTTFEVTDDEKECARRILPGYLLYKNPLDNDTMAIEEDLSFEAELAKTSRRIKKVREAEAQLDSADIELRWVRLQDVLDHLHPALKDVQIDIRADYCRPQDQARILEHLQTRSKTTFFDGVVECWKREALPKKLEVGTIKVKITHEK